MPVGASPDSARRSPAASAALAALVAVAALLAPMLTAAPVAAAPTPSTPPSAPSTPPATPTAPAPPTPAVLSEAIDGLAEYQGQSVCSPAAKPGTLRLAALLRDTYGIDDIGIERACSDGGQSEHKEGRALDWMVSLRVPAQRAMATAFLAWLLAPDAQGHPAAMAQRLGVMYIGWNSRIWRSYRADAGWAELKGCFATPSTSYDTYCHRDHVHLTLSWDAAAGRTSFWGGAPDLRPACPAYGASGSTPPRVIGTDVVAVTAVRLVDTRTGKGAGGSPCRLSAPRWSGDGRAIAVRATGVGAVPSADVGAVRLAVSVLRSNAPTTVTVRPSGGGAATARGVAQVTINGSKTASVVVPVGSDGNVTVRTSAGATDVAVSVTGWVVAVPQPAATPTTPAPVTTAPPVRVAPGVAPWPGVNLRLGMRAPSVISLQRGLLAKGYGIPSLAGAAARFGTFDPATRAAVVRWQRRHTGYGAADGVVRARVYVAITTPAAGATAPTSPAPTPAPTPTPTPTTTPTATTVPVPAGVAPWPGVNLRLGMRGPSVISLQKALIARGYRIAGLTGSGAVLGTFDSATQAAVIAFQRATPAYGAADGVVGPKTYAYVTSVLA